MGGYLIGRGVLHLEYELHFATCLALVAPLTDIQSVYELAGTRR